MYILNHCDISDVVLHRNYENVTILVSSWCFPKWCCIHLYTSCEPIIENALRLLVCPFHNLLFPSASPRKVYSYNAVINSCQKGLQWQLALFFLECMDDANHSLLQK